LNRRIFKGTRKDTTMSDFVKATLTAAGPGVVLFSKSYCPYCVRAKHALLRVGITPVVVELDERQDGREIQVALLQMTGQRTVPSAWLDGKHIGGGDDVVQGVASGLFKDVPKQEAKENAENAGLKPCGKGDGVPCLCWEK
jgi:glutaredoxin 3